MLQGKLIYKEYPNLIKYKNGLYHVVPDLSIKKVHYEDWYKVLQETTLYNQENMCAITGKVDNLQLHHALITKGMVRNLPDKVKNLINCSYNVLALDAGVHLNADGGSPTDRGKCVEILETKYGAAVVGWYEWMQQHFNTKLPVIF